MCVGFARLACGQRSRFGTHDGRTRSRFVTEPISTRNTAPRSISTIPTLPQMTPHHTKLALRTIARKMSRA